MAKVLKCGELFPGCAVEARGETEEEILKQAAEHARRDHGMPQIPPDVARKAQAAIRDK